MLDKKNKMVDFEITSPEIEQMSSILNQKYGDDAVKIAQYLADEHILHNDNNRAMAWQRVTAYLSKRV